MINVTLDEALFGVETLTDTIRSFAEEDGARACTPLFRAGRQIIPDGNSASWTELQFSRHLAPITGRDAPHVQVAPETEIPRASAMASIKVYKDLPASTLLRRRAPGSSIADKRVVINNALEDLNKLIGNSIELMCSQALSTGSITVNVTNYPGSQVTFTVTFTGFATYTYTTSWAIVSTKISSAEMVLVEQAFRAATGRAVKRAVINATTKGYLSQNTEVQQLGAFAYGAAILAGAAANLGAALPGLNLGGIAWAQADGVYKPVGGSATNYFPTKVAAFLPGDLRNTLALAEGFGDVPMGDSVESAPQRGLYAYAAVNPDTPSVRLYAGWNGLPIILCPQEVMVGTVAP